MFAYSPNIKRGVITIWSGAIADIPNGWALCDGNNGTPDLRDEFVFGAGGALNPGESAGEYTHDHLATQGGHYHGIVTGSGVASGAGKSTLTNTKQPTITVYAAANIPPFYTLAFIMKL